MDTLVHWALLFHVDFNTLNTVISCTCITDYTNTLYLYFMYLYYRYTSTLYCDRMYLSHGFTCIMLWLFQYSYCMDHCSYYMDYCYIHISVFLLHDGLTQYITVSCSWCRYNNLVTETYQ